MQVKHRVFNPMWGGLPYILAEMEAEGWGLSHIVPSTDYQAVAVFMRAEEEPEEVEEETYLLKDNAGRLHNVDKDGSYL